MDSVPGEGEARRALDAIHALGKKAGVSLLLTEPLSLLEPLWEHLDTVTILGTAMGIKGASMDPSVPARITQACDARRARRGLNTEILADGGIRRETVPLIAAAGADYIVPGSLMFKENPAQMRAWLATIGNS